MFHAEIDKSSNTLKVRYSEHVGLDETNRAVEQLPALLAELQVGFRLLTDLTALESMDLACVPHLRRTMDLCNQKGVDLVVRVIPDPHKDIGLNILSLFHYRRDVRIVTCEKLQVAEQVLQASKPYGVHAPAAPRQNPSTQPLT